MKKKINVLGQDYDIVSGKIDNDPKLKEWNGYHEPYSKKIVVDAELSEDNAKILLE